MREIMSPRGSFIAIIRSSLPAGFDQAGDQALRAEVTQRNARELVFSVKTPRPTSHFAAVAHPGSRRVAWQLGEFEGGSKALLHGLALVARDRSQSGTPPRIFFAQPLSSVVFFD